MDSSMALPSESLITDSDGVCDADRTIGLGSQDSQPRRPAMGRHCPGGTCSGRGRLGHGRNIYCCAAELARRWLEARPGGQSARARAHQLDAPQAIDSNGASKTDSDHCGHGQATVVTVSSRSLTTSGRVSRQRGSEAHVTPAVTT